MTPTPLIPVASGKAEAMTVFTAERTARKPHKCSRCGGAIRAGERYASIRITPGGEMGYLGWSRLAEHLSYTACDYEMAASAAPDAPDWLGGSDWPETPEPSCPVCRDTGIVQCPEQDGTGMYEQACPERVHDGEDVTFPADSTPTTPLSDWDW